MSVEEGRPFPKQKPAGSASCAKGVYAPLSQGAELPMPRAGGLSPGPGFQGVDGEASGLREGHVYPKGGPDLCQGTDPGSSGNKSTCNSAPGPPSPQPLPTPTPPVHQMVGVCQPRTAASSLPPGVLYNGLYSVPSSRPPMRGTRTHLASTAMHDVLWGFVGLRLHVDILVPLVIHLYP